MLFFLYKKKVQCPLCDKLKMLSPSTQMCSIYAADDYLNVLLKFCDRIECSETHKLVQKMFFAKTYQYLFAARPSDPRQRP